MITTKDYKLIAKAIESTFWVRRPLSDSDKKLYRDLVAWFVILLQKDNPRFNENLFLEACGGTYDAETKSS